MERGSHFERVVGASPEDEGAILGHLKQNFDTRFHLGAEGKSIEKEKSPELKQCIEGMTRYMHGFLREYDAQAIDIRPDQVHFIDKDKVPEDLLKTMSHNERALGTFDPGRQWISVFYGEDQTNRRKLSHVIAHEMIHFNSFGSLQLKKGAEGNPTQTQTRRTGLVVRSGGFFHFNDLNEAVTEELAIRFEQKYFKDLEYTHPEVEPQLNAIQENLERVQRALENSKEPKDKEVNTFRLKYWQERKLEVISMAAYPNEREKLNDMIDDIFNANKDQFGDKEDVFKIFVTGMLKGRLLPLARIIDKTYGKGSFSKLAEDMEEIAK